MEYDNKEKVLYIDFDGRKLIEWIEDPDSKVHVNNAAKCIARRVYYEVMKNFGMEQKFQW